MSVKKGLMYEVVRPIGLAFVFVTSGSLLALVMKAVLDRKIPGPYVSAITFAGAAFGAFVVFPRLLRSPFGDIGLSEYLRRLGFYLPREAWKHVLLGCVLAACTLSGMWVGSLLTGRYALDWSTVDISHTLFSINPGLWEEFFYRGVVMFVLLRATRSLRRSPSLRLGSHTQHTRPVHWSPASSFTSCTTCSCSSPRWLGPST